MEKFLAVYCKQFVYFVLRVYTELSVNLIISGVDFEGLFGISSTKSNCGGLQCGGNEERQANR